MIKKQFILNLRCLAYKASKIKTNLMLVFSNYWWKRQELCRYYDENGNINNINFRKPRTI